jgi:transposase
MISEELRNLIVSQLKDGRTLSEIALIFKTVCSRATVYRVGKEFLAGVEKRPRKEQKHPPKKVTSKMAARMLGLLTTAKKHYSYRSVARLMNLDETTVRYHMKKKKINCYKKVKRNLVPKIQKESRRICSMKFRKTYRTCDIPFFLFVDECYITVKKHFNHQNERCYGKDFRLIRTWKKFREYPKTPLSAMVFAGVFRDGRTKLIVLPTGFRINQYTYKDKCLIPMLKGLSKGIDKSKIIFYQDKAPCHAAASVQRFLKEELPSFVPNDSMPPNSPDLNPLDYSIWNMLKEGLDKHGLISNFKKLKRSLKSEWKAISQEAIQASIDIWLFRVRRVEQERGGNIE